MDDLRERARALINQHGDAAAEVAKARSLRFRALGDAADAILWERVMDIALEMLAEPLDSGVPMNHGRHAAAEAARAAQS
ncbi:MAG: hypothetical protein AB7M05_15335 [Alphaproteobacteria bacterium]